MENRFSIFILITLPNMKPYLLLVAFVAAIGGFLFGFDTSVISGAIVSITPKFGLNEFQEGWAVASILIGCMIGAVLCGKPSDIWGRKKTLMLTALIFLVSSVGCALSGSYGAFVSFRLAAGLAVGAASVLSPMYISEIAPPDARGKLVSFNQLATFTGQALAFASNKFIYDWVVTRHWHIGSYGDADVWRYMLGVMVIPSALFLIFIFFIPETPRWLILRNREKDARNVLMKVSEASSVDSMIGEIRESIKNAGQTAGFRELFRGKMRKATLIGILIAVFQQITGINVMMYYAPKIFSMTGVPESETFMMTMIMGLVNLFFTIVSMSLIEKWGRKILLMIGSVGMGVFMLALSIMFYTDNFTNPVIVLIFVMGYLAFFALSLGPIAWVVIGEIFPTRARGIGSAVSIFAMWLANFAISYSLPILLKHIGGGSTFIIYAAACVPCFFFVKYCLIETKGKSLEQIETELMK